MRYCKSYTREWYGCTSTWMNEVRAYVLFPFHSEQCQKASYWVVDPLLCLCPPRLIFRFRVSLLSRVGVYLQMEMLVVSVMIGLVTHVIVAMIVNNLSPRRAYPVFW